MLRYLNYAEQAEFHRAEIAANTAASAGYQRKLVGLATAQLAATAAVAHGVHQNTRAVEAMHTELASIGAETNRQLDLVNGQIGLLRDDVNAGLSAVDDSIRAMRDDMNEGFDRVVKELKALQKAVKQSDMTRVSLEHKQEAFHWFVHDEPGKALVSAVAAFSIVTAGAIKSSDEAAMDPETNVMAARLLFSGVQPDRPLPNVDPVKCAKDALAYGKTLKARGQRQAAAEAAHLLADEARVRGAHAEGLKYDLQSYDLEQCDTIDALARVIAAQVLTEPAEVVGRAIAAASLVSARFPLLFLHKHALGIDEDRSSAALAAAVEALKLVSVAADGALAEQKQAWDDVSAPVVAAGPPTAMPTPTPSETDPFLVWALCTRNKVETLLMHAGAIIAWSDRVGGATHQALAREVEDMKSAARNLHAHYANVEQHLHALKKTFFSGMAVVGGCVIALVFGVILGALLRSWMPFLCGMAGVAVSWAAAQVAIGLGKRAVRSAGAADVAPLVAHGSELEAAMASLATAGAGLQRDTEPVARIGRSPQAAEALPLLLTAAPDRDGLAVIGRLAESLGVFRGTDPAAWRCRAPHQVGSYLQSTLDLWFSFGAPSFVEHCRQTLQLVADGAAKASRRPPVAPPRMSSAPRGKVFLVAGAVWLVVGVAGVAAETLPGLLGGAPPPPEATAQPAPTATPAAVTAPAHDPTVDSSLPPVPSGRSPVPKLPDWKAAVEVNSEGAGTHAPKCFAKVLREWVKVQCAGSTPGVEGISDLGSHGNDYFEFVTPQIADVLFRLRPGMHGSFRITRAEGSVDVRVVWPTGAPKPTWIGFK